MIELHGSIPRMEANRTRTSRGERERTLAIARHSREVLHLRIIWGLTQANDVDGKVVLALRGATTTLGLPTIFGVHFEKVLIKERTRSEAEVKRSENEGMRCERTREKRKRPSSSPLKNRRFGLPAQTSKEENLRQGMDEERKRNNKSSRQGKKKRDKGE